MTPRRPDDASAPGRIDRPASNDAEAEAAGLVSFARVLEWLSLSRHAVERLIDAGFVQPRPGPGRGRWFSFDDLVVLRTAERLRRAQVPTRRIVAALEQLRREMPVDARLSALRIDAQGADVVVRDRIGPRQASTGQWELDFEPAPALAPAPAPAPVPAAAPTPPARVAPVVELRRPRRDAPEAAPPPPDRWQQALAAEAVNRAEAEQIYRVLLADPAHRLDALLNLSALLCETGRADAADALLVDALADGGAPFDPPTRALLCFNRGVALEDLGRLGDAAAAYRAALAEDGALADAHHNLGGVLQALGDAQGALRHLAAYRRALRGL